MNKVSFIEKWPKLLQSIFMTCYVIGTLFCVYRLISTYQLNHDSSKVLYKEFEAFSGVAIYPMISICIVTFENKSLIRADAQSTLGPNKASNYHFAMTGELDYENNKLPSNIHFDDIVMHLQDYADSFEIENLNNEELEQWDHLKNKNNTFPFYKSYQDPKMMCFSWNTNKHTLSYVKLFLQKDKVKNTPEKAHQYYFYIYVTHDHQLIRNLVYLHKEDLWLLPNKSYNHIRIDMTGISRLSLRQNANTPCDPELENDDSKWMQRVMRDVRCVPEYWTYLMHNQSVATCNSTKQYQQFSKYFARKERKNVHEVFHQYMPPCTRMRILSSIKFLDHYEKEKIRIDFRYLSKEFEAIQNVRDFDLESLVGNIGGYVGMFLGVSLLQISNLLIMTCRTLCHTLTVNK